MHSKSKPAVAVHQCGKLSRGLGHKAGVDPKVAADQRGHAIGVAIDTYTESDLESRREAVMKLEIALSNRKSDPPVEGTDSAGNHVIEVNEVNLNGGV